MVNAALLVGLGGMLGATARYLVGQQVQGSRSVLVVNVVGSVFLGALVAAQFAGHVGSSAVLVFGTGFCGAFTTFSSFAVEVAARAGDDEHVAAGRYALVNLLGALAGVALGSVLVASF